MDTTTNVVNQREEMNHFNVINSLLNINVEKSAAEVIKELLLEIDYNWDVSFCDAQDFK